MPLRKLTEADRLKGSIFHGGVRIDIQADDFNPDEVPSPLPFLVELLPELCPPDVDEIDPRSDFLSCSV